MAGFSIFEAIAGLLNDAVVRHSGHNLVLALRDFRVFLFLPGKSKI